MLFMELVPTQNSVKINEWNLWHGCYDFFFFLFSKTLNCWTFLLWIKTKIVQMNSLRKINDVLESVWSSRDERTRNMFIEFSVQKMVLISVCYIILASWIGPHLSPRFKPLSLKTTSTIYYFIVMLSNGFFLYQFSDTVYWSKYNFQSVLIQCIQLDMLQLNFKDIHFQMSANW